MELVPLFSSIFGDVIYPLFPDVIPVITLTQVTRSGIDPDTLESTETVKSYQVQAFFENFTAQRIAVGDVTATDQKVTIIASKLATIPVLGDTITRDGTQYTIIMIERDPGNVSWILGVRI